MITYAEALGLMLDAVSTQGSESVRLEDAAERYLAMTVTAAIDAPRCDVSAMDGYAVRLLDAQNGGWLEIIGEAAAGVPFAGDIESGQAVRIFTGAHVPHGADCVVIQEEALREGDRIRCKERFGPSRHIRAKGSDFEAGANLLEAGTRLSPTAMVALAGSDRARVEVARRPTVSVIATGDELVAPGEAARTKSSIPESGSFGVAAMAVQGGASLVGKYSGADDLGVLEGLAKDAMERSDLVIVIGGASVGDRDFAKQMFEQFDLSLMFSKVAIKPGKPVWFGTADGKHVLGLPGNPSSAMVTARLFLAPLLVAMQGGNGYASVASSSQVMATDLPPSGMRETFVRARLDEDGLRAVINQESGAQAPLASSDWLIRRAPGDHGIPAGESVPAIPF